ncbi:Piwi-domain-containing protein [Hypoxylon trugodes]|uniref:Piwi-domain-containing protein n=1 Tax=Hypoxylon trugodes TaxID=326681 RepID=UPI00219FF350|nr:Piwi-domain-containing protein [Hypoxylon trugodes]KAI1382981.1 Piwi-domain-containing protein [Hypoxylon trugodes]
MPPRDKGKGKGQNWSQGQGQGRGRYQGHSQSQISYQGHGGHQSSHREQGNRGGRGGYRQASTNKGEIAEIFKKEPTSPSKEVTKAENELQASIQKQTNGEPRMPGRPGFGTLGTPVNLWANYVELKADPKVTIYRYSISFGDPKNKPTGRKLFRTIRLLLDTVKESTAVTDFADILISLKEIEDEKTYDVVYYKEGEAVTSGKSQTYQIKLKLEKVFPISELVDYLKNPQQTYPKDLVIQTLNIFLNFHPKISEKHYIVGSSKAFPLDDRNRVRSVFKGLLAMNGYYTSMRFGARRLLANINVAWGPFYREGELTRLMDDFWEQKKEWEFTALGKHLGRVKIEYKIRKRVKTIFDLASTKDGTQEGSTEKIENPPRVLKYGALAHEVEFYREKKPKEGGKSTWEYISVYDHFKEIGKPVQNDIYPVINVGTRQDPVYLPPEHCTVVAGQRAKNLTHWQHARMVEVATRDPLINATDIYSNALEALSFVKANDKMKAFGFSVPDKKLITVSGRVLGQPTVKYYSGEPQNNYKWNLRGQKLNAGGKSACWKWKCVAIIQSSKNLGYDLGRLRENLGKMGITITGDNQAHFINADGTLETRLRAFFQDAMNNFDFFLVVLPDKSGTYHIVKRLADIEIGVKTVCILANVLSDNKKNTPSLAGNLALKLNLKFGYGNQTVQSPNLGQIIDLEETMIVGIDVTHSPVHGDSSIAGMVASCDPRLAQWPAVLRRQVEARQEMVSHLQEMFTTRLRLWANKNNNKYPRNILVYRDGVSEGQYSQVLKKELEQLREACKSIYRNGETPNITIIIVAKRHHTRFFVNKEEEKGKKNNTGNPAPGTVVDRGVTEAVTWDFFLQPHNPFKGVARPTHYFVVYDQIFRELHKQNAANQLELFTLGLCYLFGRTTNAVGVCTPAYYADLVCERGKHYYKNRAATQETGDAIPGSNGLTVHENLKDGMFYI